MTFLILACEPEKEEQEINNTIDFRDKLVGKYQVTETFNSYGAPGICNSFSSTKDTIITVSYGATDSTYSVLGRDVYLDANNEYYAYHYGLIFRNDSIFSTFMNGGLGCGVYEYYKGKKIP